MTYNPDSENPHGVVDPYDDAMVDEPSKFFGKAMIEAYRCILEKGKGKVPYDPVEHKGQRTSVAITITIEPLDASQKIITRDTLNWTADFKQVVRPSIERLGPRIASIRKTDPTSKEFNPLRELSNLWVSGTFVPRPDNKSGDTWTTLQFAEVYETEEQCKAAAGIVAEKALEVDLKAADARAAMAAFLPALWQQAGEDKDKFAELLKGNPMLARHFTMDSNEVLAIAMPF